jgi:hypothetical protein
LQRRGYDPLVADDAVRESMKWAAQVKDEVALQAREGFGPGPVRAARQLAMAERHRYDGLDIESVADESDQ